MTEKPSLENVEVFHNNSSCWVFQRPDRGYPSISIQGDTLALLSIRSAKLKEALDKLEIDEELAFELELLDDTLNGLWTIYQRYGLKEGILNSKSEE